MAWNSIVTGVDRSRESIHAGLLGWMTAERSKARFTLVHAAPDIPKPDHLPADTVDDYEGVLACITREIRKGLESDLSGYLPPEALSRLDTRLGRPEWVLPQVVGEVDADVIVVGGKHHHLPARWWGGSTALHLIRTLDIPVVIAASARSSLRRVLVPIDLSAAAAATLAAGRDMAKLFGAEMRIVHAVEPFPYEYALPGSPPQSWAERVESVVNDLVRATLGDQSVPPLITYGRADAVIDHEVKSWDADLVVVGSHGKGWLDRTLLGSLTEHLVKDPPTSLVVVPTSAWLEPRAPGRGEHARRETQTADARR